MGMARSATMSSSISSSAACGRETSLGLESTHLAAHCGACPLSRVRHGVPPLIVMCVRCVGHSRCHALHSVPQRKAVDSQQLVLQTLRDCGILWAVCISETALPQLPPKCLHVHTRGRLRVHEKECILSAGVYDTKRISNLIFTMRQLAPFVAEGRADVFSTVYHQPFVLGSSASVAPDSGCDRRSG